MSISIDTFEGQLPLYKFSQSKKVRDFVFHNAILKNKKLESTSIINNVILTIFSKYKTIKRNHLLNQQRSILESKLLKHFDKSNFCDKLTKYFVLSKKYGII